VSITPQNDTVYRATLTTMNSEVSSVPFMIGASGVEFRNNAPFGLLGLFLIVLLTIMFAFTAYFSITLMLMIIPVPLLLGSILGIITIPLGAIITIQIVAILLGLMLRDR
jgi:hypothetical protein